MKILNLINLTKNEDIILANLPKPDSKDNSASERSFEKIINDKLLNSTPSSEQSTKTDKIETTEKFQTKENNENEIKVERIDFARRGNKREEEITNYKKIDEISIQDNKDNKVEKINIQQSRKKDTITNIAQIKPYYKSLEQEKRTIDKNFTEVLHVIATFFNLFSNNLPHDLVAKIKSFQEKVQNEGKVNFSELLQIVSEIKKFALNNLFLGSNKKEVKGLVQKIEDNFKNFTKTTEVTILNVERTFDIKNNTKLQNELGKTDNHINFSFEIRDFRQNNKEVREIKNDMRSDLFGLTTTLFKNDGIKFNQPNVVINRQHFALNQFALNEFSGKVLINLRNGNSEMKMTLFPPELGKVFVKFESTEGGKLVGNIIVSTKEAHTLFQEHLNVLKENLINQGVNLQDITLTIDSSLYGDSERGNKELINDEKSWFIKPKLVEEKYDETIQISKSNYHEGKLNMYV